MIDQSITGLLRSLLLLLCIGAAGTAFGQQETRIYGVVTVEGDAKADGVTVLAMSPRDSTVVAFALTEEGGAYELRVRSALPQLLLSAFRMDTKREVRRADNRSQRQDFHLRASTYDLREVLVTAPTVYRRGDTISYVVSKLAGAHDEVISDVLARVPGMRVKRGGMLQYLGRDVTTVMIEGIDLTQGNYGLITENVRPRDISAVELLRSYQKVRALQGKEHSDDVAVNLRLSNKSKGIWSGAADMAVGYGRGLRTSDRVTLQYFAPKVQHLLLGYVDNTGHPRADELSGGTRRRELLGPFVTGAYAAPGELPQESYLDNRTAYLSQSSALVPADSSELKIQSHYTCSLVQKESDRRTRFIDPPQELVEETHLRDRRHEALLQGDYELNKSTLYLQDHFSLSYLDLSEPGRIVPSGEAQTDRTLGARIGTVRNELSYIVSRGAVPFVSRVEVSYARSAEHFDSPPDILQHLRQDRLAGRGSLRLTGLKLGRGWRYIPEGALQYRRGRFLAPAATALDCADLSLDQAVEYKSRTLFAQLDLLAGGLLLRSEREGLRCGYLLPSLSLEWKPSFRWSADGRFSLGQRLPEVEELYPGALYIDYRTVVDSEEVRLHRDRTMMGQGRVTYSDVFHLLSLFVRGRYLSLGSSYLSDYAVTERLTRIRPAYAPHRLQQMGADFQFSKGFGWKGLMTILDLSLDRTETEVMSGGKRLPYRSDALRGGVKVSMAPVRQLTMEYRVTPRLSWSRYGTEERFRSVQVGQQAAINAALVPTRLYCTLRADHSLLRHSGGRGESLILHADVYCKVTDKWTLELSGDNLLGAQYYDRITYTDFGEQIARYPLRPRMVLLRTRVLF